MLNKSLIRFSVDGRGCVRSLLFDRGRGHEEPLDENGR